MSDERLPRGLLSDDALPLFEQVAGRLRDDLVDAGARPGDRLPSERVLTQRYGVSRVTVRSALAELERRRVVRPSASRGWFVDDEGSAPAPGAHVQGFADWATMHGIATTAEVLAQQVRPCTVAEAEVLRVAPGTELFDLVRLRSLEGLVVVHERNRLPLAMCPALADTDFADASLYATLAAGRPPQVPRVADYSVEARQADADEERLLELAGLAVPVLVATQLSYNQDHRPLEYTVAAYRGDRYRFRASITNQD
ncbi:GntR family transcriptional regulator [Solicola sp. PLA-1-18]|uniref:GntR family transcriptional regulator n=1 Tax=Solicola sp. PLA-1-18 TaxID=3380532 RepID=UPI003B7BEA4E